MVMKKLEKGSFGRKQFVHPFLSLLSPRRKSPHLYLPMLQRPSVKPSLGDYIDPTKQDAFISLSVRSLPKSTRV